MPGTRATVLILGSVIIATFAFFYFVHVSAWPLDAKIATVAISVALLQCGALVWTILVSIGTARRQLRAYVLPDSCFLAEGNLLKPPAPEHVGEPGIILILKNSGQTPAYDCVSWTQIAVTEPTNADTLIVPLLSITAPSTFGAGQSIRKTIWFGRPLTAEENADVVHGRKYIFVYGRLEYRDTFNQKRWANFRLQYAGPFPPPENVIFYYSEKGNDSK
ncbi:MAG TPA: hypothetical protein VNF46_06165 [Gammaproteobacteria bacterium]|nr:hypothetical protein [Gammaproteobacteria bacterium]